MGWNDIKPELDHLSVSQISMYQRCPKQYEFRYVKGIKKAPDSGLVVGISVHSSIEHNYKEKFATRQAANKNEVLDIYAQKFEAQKNDAVFDEPVGKAKDRGYKMAQTHYDRVAPTVQPLEKPELAFEIEIPDVKKKFIGFIDVIGKPMMRNGRFIIDNKTGRRRYNQFEVDTSSQLTAYQYAHRKVFPKLKVDGVSIHSLVESKGGAVEPGQYESRRTLEELKRFEETVQAVDKSIKAGIFYPTDNPMTCSWCGYNSICHKRAVEARNLKREEA